MNTKKVTIHSIFLNQSDQHFLKDYLRDEINLLEQHLFHYQKQAAYFWSKCDPQGQPNNAYYYLNESKDSVRSILRKLKYLRRIQKQVKGSTRDTFDIMDTEE